MSKHRFFLRFFSLGTLLFLLKGCATNEHVRLSYSSEFALSMPVSDLAGGVVFSADELALKTRDGNLLSGSVLSSSTEGFSDDFVMTNYPKFLFGLESLETLDPEEARLFENSANEIRHTYGDADVAEARVGEFTTYTTCGEAGCLAYVTKDGFNDHILSVHGSGISRDEFTSLINGGYPGGKLR